MYKDIKEMKQHIESLERAIKQNKQNQIDIIRDLTERLESDVCMETLADLIIKSGEALQAMNRNYHALDNQLMLMTDVTSVMYKEFKENGTL